MSKKRSYLGDAKYLLVLLTAIVKKEGGELILSQDELTAVVANDLITMMADVKTKNIVLRVNYLTDPGAGEYEN
jgi:hypothetical protein